MELSGFQLVPAVTELIVAELMYLQWMDPKEPIYLYINSTGTTRDDGETVRLTTLLPSEFINKTTNVSNHREQMLATMNYTDKHHDMAQTTSY